MGGPGPTGAQAQTGIVPSGQGATLWPMAAGQQWVAGRQMGPPLPRPLRDFVEGLFGPLAPMQPMPIDQVEEGAERPGPRRLQYPIAWNIPIGQPGMEGLKLAPFATLRNLADRSSYARAMLNIRKDEIVGSEWDIGATAEVSQQIKGDKQKGKDIKDRAATLVKWFKRPDPDYYSFASWIGAVLEERFVTDAVALYLHPTRVPGKGIFNTDTAAFEVIDGTTIRPLYDIRGNLPAPPRPAYQQYLYGVARSEFSAVFAGLDLEEMAVELDAAGIEIPDEPDDEFQGDQLWYLPRYKRVWTPYGFPEIEQALLPISLSMSRQAFLLDFFAEGTIPGVYVVAGDAYATPTQQKTLQDSLNALAGDVAWKHRVIVLPPGSKTDAQKDMTWTKDADTTIAEMLMMILHIQPHEVGMVPGGRTSGLGGKGMAEEQAAAVQKTRTIPELEWLKQNLLDPAIQRVFGQDDLEWKWLGFEEEEDESLKTESEKTFISIGKMTIDEARIEDGLDPFNLPLTSTPIIIAGPTVTPLDPTVPPPPPPPAPTPGLPGLGPDGKPLPGQSPATAALAASSLPTKSGSDKPKANPIANLTSDKKGKRKKARKELVNRFEDNLKQQQGAAVDAAKDREKKMPDVGKVAGLDVLPLQDFVAKWKIKYNDGKLDGDNGIVHTYLLRSYPPDVVDWAAKGDWSFDRHVPLDQIDYKRRPGGRDPEKVQSIGESLDKGASMDPVVLVKDGDKLIVADGYHRLLGAEHAGWKDVPAFIGEGFEKNVDEINGAMQAESDSKKKVQKAELGALGRYLRKQGNIVDNFRTNVLPERMMKRLAADYPTQGQDAIRKAAKAIDALTAPPSPEWLIRMKAWSGGSLTDDELTWLHKAAAAEGEW